MRTPEEIRRRLAHLKRHSAMHVAIKQLWIEALEWVLEEEFYPRYCADCGAFLMGGDTEHGKDCAFQKIIDEHFPSKEPTP